MLQMWLNSLATKKKIDYKGFLMRKNMFYIKKPTNSLATALATKYFMQKTCLLGQKVLFS